MTTPSSVVAQLGSLVVSSHQWSVPILQSLLVTVYSTLDCIVSVSVLWDLPAGVLGNPQAYVVFFPRSDCSLPLLKTSALQVVRRTNVNRSSMLVDT